MSDENGYDESDPLNIGYNDGWNDAIEQAVKIVNDARGEGRDLREIRDELKGLIQKVDTPVTKGDEDENTKG